GRPPIRIASLGTPAVLFDELASDCERQPRARVFGGEVRLEYTGEQLLVNSWAIITNHQAHTLGTATPLGLTPCSAHDNTGLLGIAQSLDSVAKYIVQHLP